MRPMAERKSIEATYDSRETGYRYHVTTRVGDRTIGFQKRVPDPFVRTTVTVGVLDLLRGLFGWGLAVTVIVGADQDVVDDVLELDDNTLISGSTRRAEFDKFMGKAIKFHVND